MAARPRDIADVIDVLFMQGQLDATYMRHWAKELGVEQALEKALQETAKAERNRRKREPVSAI
jgi:hypothetical protein